MTDSYELEQNIIRIDIFLLILYKQSLFYGIFSITRNYDYFSDMTQSCPKIKIQPQLCFSLKKLNTNKIFVHIELNQPQHYVNKINTIKTIPIPIYIYKY